MAKLFTRILSVLLVLCLLVNILEAAPVYFYSNLPREQQHVAAIERQAVVQELAGFAFFGRGNSNHQAVRLWAGAAGLIAAAIVSGRYPEGVQAAASGLGVDQRLLRLIFPDPRSAYGVLEYLSLSAAFTLTQLPGWIPGAAMIAGKEEDSVESRFEKALALVNTGNFADAEPLLASVITDHEGMNPQLALQAQQLMDVTLRANLRSIKVRMNWHKHFERWAKEHFDRDPLWLGMTLSDALRFQGLAELEQVRIDAALRLHQRAVEALPKSAQGAVAITYYRYMVGDLKCLEGFALVSRWPKSHNAHDLDLGIAALREGIANIDVSNHLGTRTKALALTFYALGLTKQATLKIKASDRKNTIDEAARNADLAEDLNHRSISLFHSIIGGPVFVQGIVAAARGEWDKAIDLFALARERGFSEADINAELVPILLKQGRLDDALRLSLKLGQGVQVVRDRLDVYAALAQERPDQAPVYQKASGALWKSLLQQPSVRSYLDQIQALGPAYQSWIRTQLDTGNSEGAASVIHDIFQLTGPDPRWGIWLRDALEGSALRDAVMAIFAKRGEHGKNVLKLIETASAPQTSPPQLAAAAPLTVPTKPWLDQVTQFIADKQPAEALALLNSLLARQGFTDCFAMHRAINAYELVYAELKDPAPATEKIRSYQSLWTMANERAQSSYFFAYQVMTDASLAISDVLEQERRIEEGLKRIAQARSELAVHKSRLEEDKKSVNPPHPRGAYANDGAAFTSAIFAEDMEQRLVFDRWQRTGETSDLMKTMENARAIGMIVEEWEKARERALDALRHLQERDGIPAEEVQLDAISPEWIGLALAEQAILALQLSRDPTQDRPARIAQAEKFLAEGASKAPEYHRLLLARGLLLLEEGQFRQSRPYLRLALRKGSRNDAFWGLMLSYMGPGDQNLAKAERWFARIEKPDAAPRYDMGRIALMRDDYPKAFAIWFPLLKDQTRGELIATGDIWELHRGLARAGLETGHVNEAAQSIAVLIREGRQDAALTEALKPWLSQPGRWQTLVMALLSLKLKPEQLDDLHQALVGAGALQAGDNGVQELSKKTEHDELTASWNKLVRAAPFKDNEKSAVQNFLKMPTRSPEERVRFFIRWISTLWDPPVFSVPSQVVAYLFDAVRTVIKLDVQDDSLKDLAAAVLSWLEPDVNNPRHDAFKKLSEKTKANPPLFAQARNLARDIHNIRLILVVEESLKEAGTQLRSVKDLDGEILLKPENRDSIRAIRARLREDKARAPAEELRQQASALEGKVLAVEKRLEQQEAVAATTIQKAVLQLTASCLDEILALGLRASQFDAAAGDRLLADLEREFDIVKSKANGALAVIHRYADMPYAGVPPASLDTMKKTEALLAQIRIRIDEAAHTAALFRPAAPLFQSIDDFASVAQDMKGLPADALALSAIQDGPKHAGYTERFMKAEIQFHAASDRLKQPYVSEPRFMPYVVRANLAARAADTALERARTALDEAGQRIQGDRDIPVLVRQWENLARKIPDLGAAAEFSRWTAQWTLAEIEAEAARLSSAQSISPFVSAASVMRAKSAFDAAAAAARSLIMADEKAVFDAWTSDSEGRAQISAFERFGKEGASLEFDWYDYLQEACHFGVELARTIYAAVSAENPLPAFAIYAAITWVMYYAQHRSTTGIASAVPAEEDRALAAALEAMIRRSS